MKVGGLGDVAGSLPSAVRDCSVDIRLVIPLHGSIDPQSIPLKKICEYALVFQTKSIPVEVFAAQLGDLPVYLISGPFIDSDGPVYSADPAADVRKFTYFSLAALRLPSELGWRMQILHANDWHTALAVYALRQRNWSRLFQKKPISILSVHNLPYLGDNARQALEGFGVPIKNENALPMWARELPMPLGLLHADRIVAVSPTYAKEILTPGYGSGLEKYLQSQQARISGILNGLDFDRWNPGWDTALEQTFDLDHFEQRSENRSALQSDLGLPLNPDAMLVGMVSRMDWQKGIDLVLEAFRRLPLLLKEPIAAWQLVFLGTGSPEIEAEAHGLQRDFPNRVRVVTRFDDRLSRRIYAGADLMLIPSRYEPCGLTQMIAMHYGCVPVARATGGLRDTILDFNACKDSTGFLFEDATPELLIEALLRAMRVFTRPGAWKKLQKRGMQTDFSWLNSARQYQELYRSLVSDENASSHQPR